MDLDWKQLWNYSNELINQVPQYVYEGAGSILCIGLVIFVALKGWRTGLRYTLVLLLIEYLFLLFCSTVICRNPLLERKYDFQPLWSYKAIGEGQTVLLSENVMNVLAFIPVGVLLGFMFQGSRFKMTWWKALQIGCSISITIEALQFCFMKGFSEVDDVMHNTLGCLIGFGFMIILRIIFKTRYNNV